MRIWTLHPKYLDAKGLVALWREGLLARKVLQGKTRGYRNHPQLVRFKTTARPLETINAYLACVLDEALARGYRFDSRKIRRGRRGRVTITETRGQLLYERKHLLGKLRDRDPGRYATLKAARKPLPHPLFNIISGGIREWEIR